MDKIKFQRFNDGCLSVYPVDEDGVKSDTPRYAALRYESRTIGAGRYFAAQQANIEFSDLVRVPLRKDISSYDVVVMGGKEYSIKQLQEIHDTNPPCLQMTLMRLG